MTEDTLERATALANKKGYIQTSSDWQELIKELIAEVERLRSNYDDQIRRDLQDINFVIAAKDARIKELEASVVDGRAQYLLMLRRNPGIAAWNFDELSEEDQNTLREQAAESLKMEEPWALIQLREARERIKELEARVSTWKITAEMALTGQAQIVQDDLKAKILSKDFIITKTGRVIKEQRKQIERLEAAFLEAKRDLIYFRDAPDREAELVELYDEAEQKARKALEEIKAGGKDELYYLKK